MWIGKIGNVTVSQLCAIHLLHCCISKCIIFNGLSASTLCCVVDCSSHLCHYLPAFYTATNYTASVSQSSAAIHVSTVSQLYRVISYR